MEYVAMLCLAALAVAVIVACRRHGAPGMVSELYYRERHGWMYAALMVAAGASMLPVMLDRGGWQWAAFVTCMGLVFVGVAPAYLEDGERQVHKWAATTSAVAGILWCASVGALWAVGVAAWGCAISALGMYANGGEEAMGKHWLFAAEVAAMTMVAMATFVG